jgi:hypothetical protein
VEAMKTFHATGTGDEVGITRPLIALSNGTRVRIQALLLGACVG